MKNLQPLVSVVIPTHNRREKLIKLIDSILCGDYPTDRLEIIVVDDASTDGTYEEIKRRFPEVKVIRNSRELLLAGSRNIGIRNSNGEYIFLIDDDNIVNKNIVKLLVDFMERYPNVGVVTPLMLYHREPDRVWCAGVKRSYITSKTIFLYRDKKACEVKEKVIESGDLPNAFMVRREVFEKVNLFDDKKFPIHYDEADFCARVRKAGYKVVCYTKAKVWHDIPLPEEVKDKARFFHCHNELRAYYCGRNRILFHKKHSKKWQYLIFILIFNWLFMMYYLKVILLNSNKPFRERLKIAKAYVKGAWEGIKHDEKAL